MSKFKLSVGFEWSINNNSNRVVLTNSEFKHLLDHLKNMSGDMFEFQYGGKLINDDIKIVKDPEPVFLPGDHVYPISTTPFRPPGHTPLRHGFTSAGPTREERLRRVEGQLGRVEGQLERLKDEIKCIINND